MSVQVMKPPVVRDALALADRKLWGEQPLVRAMPAMDTLMMQSPVAAPGLDRLVFAGSVARNQQVVGVLREAVGDDVSVSSIISPVVSVLQDDRKQRMGLPVGQDGPCFDSNVVEVVRPAKG